MAIMDFFRSAQPAASVQAPAVPAAVPTNQAPATAQPDGNHSNTTTPNLPVNPLDAYSKMFDNANKATPDAAPTFALDSKTVGEVAGSLDFTKDLPADLMTKALAGDAQALIQAMNMVGRNAYQTSIQHTSALTDKFVGARLDHDGKQLGSKVRSELVTSALSTTPNFNHPVAKQELNRVAAMLSKEHPDATPQQIAESAQKYLMDLNSALQPIAPKNQNQKDQEFDWSGYLNS